MCTGTAACCYLIENNDASTRNSIGSTGAKDLVDILEHSVIRINVPLRSKPETFLHVFVDSPNELKVFPFFTFFLFLKNKIL